MYITLLCPPAQSPEFDLVKGPAPQEWEWLRLGVRAARRGQAGWQQLGHGVDEAGRRGDRCRRLVGGDRSGGRADAIVCRRLKLVRGRQKAAKFAVDAWFAARKPCELAADTAMRDRHLAGVFEDVGLGGMKCRVVRFPRGDVR